MTAVQEEDAATVTVLPQVRVGGEGWLAWSGLDARYVILPLITAALSAVCFVGYFFEYLIGTEGFLLSRIDYEFIGGVFFVAMLAGGASIVPGLPGWLVGWACARRLGAGKRTAAVVASGVAAFSGMQGLVMAVRLPRGLSWVDASNALGLAAAPVPVAMFVAIWLYRKNP